MAQTSVRYGVNKLVRECAGQTVGEVKNELLDVLNIPTDAQARVNHANVDNHYVVKTGDEVEFIKPAGEKGAVRA